MVDVLVKKSLVYDANATYVQKLRVPKDASDDQIQAALNQLFSQNMGTENQSVLKMPTQDNVQHQEQLLNQIKPEISDRVQDQVQCQRSDEDCKLSILGSGVLIDGQFKNKIYSLLKNERPYNSIIAELEARKIEIREKGEVYRMKRGMLVVHQNEQNTDFDFWRAIIPDEVAVKNFILTELHSIPYSLHPGIQRTLQKVKKHFFWKGMTGNVREYVESCPVCQIKKTDHTLGRGNLQSTSIPEKKWSEVSVDFVTDLPVTRSKKDSILNSSGQGNQNGTFNTLS